MLRFLFFSFIFFSCATTSKYEERLKQWLGGDIEVFSQQWGQASYSFQLPNEKRVYIWLWVGNLLVNKNNYDSALKDIISKGGNVSYNWCKTTLYTNKEGIIIDYSFEGNYCKAK